MAPRGSRILHQWGRDTAAPRTIEQRRKQVWRCSHKLYNLNTAIAARKDLFCTEHIFSFQLQSLLSLCIGIYTLTCLFWQGWIDVLVRITLENDYSLGALSKGVLNEGKTIRPETIHPRIIHPKNKN